MDRRATASDARSDKPAKRKQAWSKPTIKRMSYINIVKSGTTAQDVNEEEGKYIPTSS